jgi:hypothetical protein
MLLAAQTLMRRQDRRTIMAGRRPAPGSGLSPDERWRHDQAEQWEWALHCRSAEYGRGLPAWLEDQHRKAMRRIRELAAGQWYNLASSARRSLSGRVALIFAGPPGDSHAQTSAAGTPPVADAALGAMERALARTWLAVLSRASGRAVNRERLVLARSGP